MKINHPQTVFSLAISALLFTSTILIPANGETKQTSSEKEKNPAATKEAIKAKVVEKKEEKPSSTPKKETEIMKKTETEAAPQNEELKDTVVIQTQKGIIKIKLFTKEAPITTNNFIDLVKKEFYNGTVFHRVVENFVIQGGDPLGDGTGNYTDPDTGKPRFIKLERTPELKFDRPGRVGMARTADPNSASCQFFIALQALPSLDPGGVDPYGYAIFGQVTEDTFETVKKIAQESKPAFPGSDKPANPVKMHLLSLE